MILGFPELFSPVSSMSKKTRVLILLLMYFDKKVVLPIKGVISGGKYPAWPIWPGWIFILLNRNVKCWIWMVTKTFHFYGSGICLQTGVPRISAEVNGGLSGGVKHEKADTL